MIREAKLSTTSTPIKALIENVRKLIKTGFDT